MILVFRELDNAIKLVKNNPRIEPFRTDALIKYRSFIESGVWGHRKKMRRTTEILRSIGMDEVEASKVLRVSPLSVRSIWKRNSEKIRKAVGYDCINKILGGTEQEVASIVSRFKTRDFTIESLVLPEVLENLNSKGVDLHCDFTLKDVEAELRYLRRFSHYRLNEDFKSLDKKKLSFILFILGSSKFTEIGYKAEIVSYLIK